MILLANILWTLCEVAVGALALAVILALTLPAPAAEPKGSRQLSRKDES
jgi:hypothetical protein